MKEQVKGILIDFKKAGWSVQKVERELCFSNGYLGKTVLGKSTISDVKFSQLLELHKKELKHPPTVTKKLEEQIATNNLPENKTKIEEKRNPSIPPMPIRENGEDSFDFAARKSEWKVKYNQ